jgi:hypothetical protein
MSTNKKLATVTLLIAVGMAGCGSHDDPPVTTAASDPAMTFSQCMRDQGQTWFPDRGADGGLKVSVPDGTDQSKFDKAEQACKAYDPATARNGKVSAEDLDKLRQVAQCIRDKGFPKYPDPDANGSINIDSRTAGFEPDDPKFAKAMQECQKYLPPRKGSGNS